MTVAPTLTTKPLPKLGPTPILIPTVQAYVFGDFMRAFGIDESTIRLAQQGYLNGDFRGITVTGINHAGYPQERTRLDFDDIMREGTITLDTSSQVSMTEQLSRRLAASIGYSAATMRRQGLRVTYSYEFTQKGSSNYADTLRRYGLVEGTPDQLPAGTAMRQTYSVHHKPTGATVTHESLRKIR